MNMKYKLEKLQKETGLKGMELAEKMGVTKQFYSVVKHGKRKPSKKMLKVLVELSGEPEVYWTGELDKYMQDHKSYEKINKLAEYLIEENLMTKPDDIFKPEFEELFRKAILADMAYKLEETKRNKEQ